MISTVNLFYIIKIIVNKLSLFLLLNEEMYVT